MEHKEKKLVNLNQFQYQSKVKEIDEPTQKMRDDIEDLEQEVNGYKLKYKQLVKFKEK